MYTYSIIQWLFFFYFYCFAGWCIESAWVSMKERRLTNRGFMRGPFLPLYGSGAVMMLVVSMPFRDNIVMVYVMGCVGATVLEYVTGVTMEALFKVRYWDYSKRKFNFQGHICLLTTLAWGLLTILMTRVVHMPIELLVLSIPDKALAAVTGILTVYIAVDFALSFKAAIDLRDVLVKMEQVKHELVHIQRRLDAIITVVNESLGSGKSALTESVMAAKEGLTEGMAQRIEDVKSSIESKLESLKAMVVTMKAEYPESIKEELLELKTKYAINVADRNRLGGLKDFFQRDMVRSNPYMTSEKYKESLAELKKEAVRKKGAKKDSVGEGPKEEASKKKN